jgi:hypothetical protein
MVDLINCPKSPQSIKQAEDNIKKIVDELFAKGMSGDKEAIISNLNEMILPKLGNLGTNQLGDLIKSHIGLAKKLADDNSQLNEGRTLPPSGARPVFDSDKIGEPADILSPGGFFNKVDLNKNTILPESWSYRDVRKTFSNTAVAGLEISSSELKNYFNNKTGCNDEEFIIRNWIRDGDDPLIMLDALSLMKRIHYEIIMPMARYYKENIPGTINCITSIIYGVSSEDALGPRGLGTGPTSFHRRSMACTFTFATVEDEQVISDIENIFTGLKIGTYGMSAGIHISLPFFINGELIQRLKLVRNRYRAGEISYKWT